jgi:hypothetical protein
VKILASLKRIVIKMLKTLISIFSLILFTQIIYGNQDSIDPMIIAELGKIKAVSERAHARSATLSRETIEEHNVLATEVNGFIDGAIMCIQDNKVDSHNMRQRVSTLNHKMNAFVQDLTSSQEKFARGSVNNELLMERHFDVQNNALLGIIIPTTIIWITEKTLDFLFNGGTENSKNDKQKEDFIHTLEQQKWLKIDA